MLNQTVNMLKQQQTKPEYVELDEFAQVSVDLYLESQRLKRDHDRHKRTHEGTMKSALEDVKQRLDGATLGVLPDGRQVRLVTHERKCKPQPAREYSYDELKLVTE